MFYVDDSGSTETGLVIYSWIECVVEDWRHGLRAWLDLRKRLYTAHAIPADYELHATKFVGGRGRPSLDEAWNRSKANRSAVAEEALATIAACPQLEVGSVYRRVSRRRDYGDARAELYERWIDHVDHRLAGVDELGLVYVDGDGTDHRYLAAHRELKLADRHVIEDPMFQHSHRSQWVQMADLVAYAAYQHLARYDGKEFAWGWYERYLMPRDVNGGPLKL